MLFIKRHKDEVNLPMTTGRLPPSPLIGVIGRRGLIYDNIAIVTRKYDILKLKAFYPFTNSNFIFPSLKSIVLIHTFSESLEVVGIHKM